MSGTITNLATLRADGGLVADTDGDLFGVTSTGTVYEFVNTATGYAATPNVVGTLPIAADGPPQGGLAIDANGDLFGTLSGQYEQPGDGAVFEIANTATGYTTTPTILVTFNGADGAVPQYGLLLDSQGDVFGSTSSGGTYGEGTVFEIVKTATGYGSTPIVLVNFNRTDGSYPSGGLIEDANGDLFGTTSYGGTGNSGTVFEIANTTTGYASTPITLCSFAVPAVPNEDPYLAGANPTAGLVMDSSGDLFGIASNGGADDFGTVFELVKTGGTYASAPTILVTFNGFTGGDGHYSNASLIIDAHGDLFGTTDDFFPDGGTVFEIANTPTGYASTLTVLAEFPPPQANSDSVSNLIVNAEGDLLGTTVLGSANGTTGTVFEVSNTGYILCYGLGTSIATLKGSRAVETLRPGDVVFAAGPERVWRPQTVRWIGVRTLDLATHPEPELAAPIRIRAGALAPDLPRRDLVLSPDHCLLFDGHLLRAFRLLNGASVVQEQPARVTYVHIELERHALLLAEGVAAESYLDEGHRGFFDGATGLPGPLADRTTPTCAPFAPDDAFAERIWRRVAAGAQAPAPAPRSAPALRLLASGRPLHPAAIQGGRHLYALPPSATELRLISPAARPTDSRPWAEDRRRLGLRIASVTVDGARMPLDGPQAARGWWCAEPDGCRWTDGDASLALPPAASVLEVRLS